MHGVGVTLGDGEPPRAEAGHDTLYAALDLGTNNCRLMVARPSPRGFRIVDTFSRLVRLGEGLATTGALSPAAMERTIAALGHCARRLDDPRIARRRLVATEACRRASNGSGFLAAVEQATGLRLDILDRRSEAQLAAAGCAELMDPEAESALLFDIGGGSTEVVWLAGAAREPRVAVRILAWTSLPVGVVTLAERYGGGAITAGCYRRMIDEVASLLAPFAASVPRHAVGRRFHLLGTSGTVTTLGGLHLGLPRYERRRVDGLWLRTIDAKEVIARLLRMDHAARVRHGCIGEDRADLVMAGCAIYEAIALRFPAPRLRIADRGLREGILFGLMAEDGHGPAMKSPA